MSSYCVLHLFSFKGNESLYRPSILLKVFVFPFRHFLLNLLSAFKVSLLKLVSSLFEEIEHFTLLEGKLYIKDITGSLLLYAFVIVLQIVNVVLYSDFDGILEARDCMFCVTL